MFSSLTTNESADVRACEAKENRWIASKWPVSASSKLDFAAYSGISSLVTAATIDSRADQTVGSLPRTLDAESALALKPAAVAVVEEDPHRYRVGATLQPGSRSEV